MQTGFTIYSLGNPSKVRCSGSLQLPAPTGNITVFGTSAGDLSRWRIKFPKAWLDVLIFQRHKVSTRTNGVRWASDDKVAIVYAHSLDLKRNNPQFLIVKDLRNVVRFLTWWSQWWCFTFWLGVVEWQDCTRQTPKLGTSNRTICDEDIVASLMAVELNRSTWQYLTFSFD
jgi:hypothetical protein